MKPSRPPRPNPLYDYRDEAPRPRCKMRGCRKVISLREAQADVCDEHAMRIWEHVQRYRREPAFVEEAVKGYERKLRTEAWADDSKRKHNNPTKRDMATAVATFFPIDPKAPEPEEFVDEDIYYVRQGELIKIGYSTRLYDRLFAYGPTAEVLAHHPGTRADERDLHRTFRPFLAHGREWYTPAKILMDHIEAMTAKHGDPWCIPEWSKPKDAPHSLRRSSQAKPNGLSI